MRTISVLRTVFVLSCLLGLTGLNAGPPTLAGAPTSAVLAAIPRGSGLNYQWHSFYGVSPSAGTAQGVAVDAAGNVYIVGYSNTSWGNPLHAYSGSSEIMVLKLNQRGEYQWHTFYGASPTSSEDGDDEGAAIAVDPNGNVYVTGYSDRTWQGDNNTNPLNAHGGDAEYMVVLKLNSAGAYQWHTFMQPGRATAIAVDNTSVYLTGNAARSWGTPKHSSNGAIAVIKLNASGAYQWHSIYGVGASAGDEKGNSIAIDTARNTLYITGVSSNTWLGDGDGPPLNAFSGGASYSNDIVVLKLDTSGGYQWHTFYGASGTDDSGAGIALDDAGSPIIAGQSFDSWGSPLHAISGENDIMVLKLNSGGAYQWHTFYGSNADDEASGVAISSNGIYIVGDSSLGWLGEANLPPAYAHSGGLSDSVVLRLDSAGAYQRHSFAGAADSRDEARSIALGSDGSIFTTGTSIQNWLGLGTVPPLHAHSGNSVGDSFILKLSDKLYAVYLPGVSR